MINLEPVAINKISTQIFKYNKTKKKEEILFLKKIDRLVKDD